jgi:hypothetical protein
MLYFVSNLVIFLCGTVTIISLTFQSDGTPGKRKNLRKILKEKNLDKTTQSAAQEEKERKQRIADRQKLVRKMEGS